MTNPKILAYLCLSMALFSIAACSGTNHSGLEHWSVTALTEFGAQPHWSPDGQTILFGDDRPGSAGLWLWKHPAAPERLSEDLPPHDWDYVWSNDGSRVAFTSPGAPEDSSAGLWVVNLDGRQALRILDRGSHPSWNAADDSISLRIDVPESGEAGIYTVSADGGGDPVLRVAGGYHPKHSPVGDWLAYSDNLNGGVLYLTGPGFPAQAVTDPGALQWVWSDDGALLFCVVTDLSTGVIAGDIWKISVGATVETDTSFVSVSANPSSNHDGSRVTCQRYSGARWAGVWVLREDGTGNQIINYGQHPDYNPVSDRIAVDFQGNGLRILIKQ